MCIAIATAIKSKIVSVHVIKAHREVEVQLHLFLTSALGDMNSQLHASVALPPVFIKKDSYPIFFPLTNS